MEDNKKIEFFIKEYRVKQNLTVKQLSQIAGVTQFFIYSLENEKNDSFPNIFNLAKISKALSVPIQDLFKINFDLISIPADKY